MTRTHEKAAARRPQRRNGMERFTALLNAAERLFARMTIDEVTLHAIATEAEVPRVSAYHFFPSVEAVRVALYDRFLQEMADATLGAPATSATWQSALREVLTIGRTYYSHRPAAMRLVLSPSVRKDINKGNRRIGQLLCEWLMLNFGFRRSAAFSLACEVVIELVDAVWSKSYQEHDTITEQLFEESVKVAVCYLGTCIPEECGLPPAVTGGTASI